MSEQKIDNDVPTDISLTRTFQALINRGNVEELMSLLSQYSPNVKSTRGGFRTPLTFACYYARGPIVHILLAHNANPNVLDPEGQSCLINYLSTRELIPERDIPVINTILDQSPHLINLQSQRGITPLYQAIAYDAPLEMIRFLIDKGADVNQPGLDGSVILTAVNNIVLSMKEIEARNRDGEVVNQQNIFPNSIKNLTYLLRIPNIMIPNLPIAIEQKYPQIASLINKERARNLYNKQFVEKGKQVAILREMNVFPDDVNDEILQYLFKKGKKSSKKKGKKSIKKSGKKRVKRVK